MKTTRAPLAKAPARSDVLSRVGMLARQPTRRLESTLVTAVVDALRAIGVLAIRQNTGGAWLPKTSAPTGFRPVKFGVRGQADIMATVPVPCLCKGSYRCCPLCEGAGRLGVTLAVECKSADGRLRPEQAAFLELVRGVGGIALVAREINDVIPVVMRRMGRG